MNWDNIVTLLVGLIAAIFGYIIHYLIAKIKSQEVIAGKFATTEFLDKIKEIVKFIRESDTQEVIQIIKKIKPSELDAFNRTYQTIEEHLKTFANQLSSMQRLIEQKLFNEVTGRIHGYIEANSTFIARLGVAKDSKKYLADHILKTPIMQEVISEGKPIFIESGSTFAYLILSLIDHVNKTSGSNNLSQVKRTPMVICTNNVSIYIILLFEELFSPFLLPGKPTNQYAATFGDPKTADVFDKSQTRRFLEDHNVTTIFSTASFLDITYGPHVSSFPNWQMKRFLNKYSEEKKCRYIFVITSDNINDNVKTRDVKDICKLIFHEPDKEEEDRVSFKNLSNKDLENVNSNFRSFLRNTHSYIITASTNKKLCEDRVNALQKNFPELRKWTIELDNGLLAVLNSR